MVVIMGLTVHGKAEITFSMIATHISLSLSVTYPALLLWKIFNNTATDTFPPFSYLVHMVHIIFIWVLYIVELDPQETAVPFHIICLLLSSYIGLIFNCIYFFLVTLLCGEKKLKEQICGGSLFLLAFIFLPMYVQSHATTMRPVLGPLVVVSGIIMYASPLTMIMKSRKENSVEELTVWLCTGFFLNGLAWFIVAFVVQKIDVYLAVTNGIGMLLGILQLRVVCQLRRQYCSRYFKFHDVADYMDPLLC